ncbi:MAG: hypothetical protein IJD27_05220, partial [Alistipes sp.]|nr:hypothetical protein [Alistipes sp.]
MGKSKGGEPIISFQPSGIVASARSSVEAIPDMEYNGVNIPVCKRNFAAVSELPEDNTCLYIVSSLYA